MPKAPAFQFYPKQYVADNYVQAMEWDARGMYVHLLCMAWQEIPPGSIPNDDAVIRRWLNLSRDTEDDLHIWRRVRPQIMAAWVIRDGRWYQSGLCETWERMQRRSEASTNNVRKRYDAHVEVVQEALDPVLSKKITEPIISEIYKCYPRKEGRGAAFKSIAAALERLLKGQDSPGDLFHSLDDAVIYLTQRVKLFAGSPAGQAGEYTPHPATWFNQKRYLDDESNWSRRGEQTSKVEQRITNNRANLVDDLGDLLGERTGRSGQDVQGGTPEGRTKALAKGV